MAFTRPFLKTMGLTDEQVQAIMEEHISVTDALKAQRDKFEKEAKDYKLEADKIPGLQKQIEEASGGEDYKAKYESEHQAFENFKTDLAKKEEIAKIEKAYRQLLTDEKISDKRHDAIVRVTDFSGMKLDKDGKLENLDNLKKTIGEEWGEFKVTTTQRKQSVATPPVHDTDGSGGGRARELYQKHMEQRYGAKNDAGKE